MMNLEAQIALAVTAPQAWTHPGKGSIQASPSVYPIACRPSLVRRDLLCAHDMN